MIKVNVKLKDVKSALISGKPVNIVSKSGNIVHPSNVLIYVRQAYVATIQFLPTERKLIRLQAYNKEILRHFFPKLS